MGPDATFGASPPPWANFGTAMTESAFMSIAFYNVIELHFLLFSTIVTRRGLYFWSVFAAMWGTVVSGLAVVLKTFIITKHNTLGQINAVVAVLVLGWYFMITGQALVLYSRLHLVVHHGRVVRGVLIMIIFTVLTIEIPLTIIVFLMTTYPTGPYTNVYRVYEPLQLTTFATQEVIISAIYIYYAVKLLRHLQDIHGRMARKTMWNLIYINVFIIVLDITLISIQYAGFDTVQHFYKACVYSVKLKVEFVVLNQLLDLTKSQKSGWSSYRDNHSLRFFQTDNSGDNTKPAGKDSENSYSSLVRANNISLEHVKNDGGLKTTAVVQAMSV